jgi:hypothetical protein
MPTCGQNVAASFDEVHKREVSTEPIPQIKTKYQMKDFIEFVEEVGNAVSLQETAAQKEWEI